MVRASSITVLMLVAAVSLLGAQPAATAAELPAVTGYHARFVLDDLDAPMLKLASFAKEMGATLLAYAEER